MEIAQNVKSIVSRELGVGIEEVKEGSSFIDDLGADSLAIVELVLAIEEHFKIDIPEKETERIQTVGDVIAYIQARQVAS
jgi:acyl carrier protein